jgi:flagellin
MTQGIALSNIAQSGLSSQKELLENIKTETIKAMNGTMGESDREIIANQIGKYIEQYKNIADQTSYNGNSLLKANGTTSDDISLTTEDSIIKLEKADTMGVANNLESLLKDFTTDPEAMKKMITSVDAGLDTLSDYAADFGSASNMMMSSARGAITTEKELASAKSTIMEIDYSKEISDFSKTNIMSQIGMIMQTQANAQQAKNIELLS